MKPASALIAIACFGALILAGNYGCKKEAETAKAIPSIDSTDTKVTASKNCIDSVIGTYYGHRESHDTSFFSGVPYATVNYSGPDTVEITRASNPLVIELRPRRAYALYPTSFKFDTSRMLYNSFTGAWLYLFPEQDSISYSYHGYSGVRYDWTGSTANSTFIGRK